MDTRGAGVIASSACQKFAPEGLSRDPEVHQRSHWILPTLSLRMSREQHVHESPNHSLYLNTLFNSSSPEANFGGNKLLNGSVCRSPQNPSMTNDLHDLPQWFRTICTSEKSRRKLILKTQESGRKKLLDGCGACPLLVGPSARSHMVAEREHDPLALRPRESEW